MNVLLDRLPVAVEIDGAEYELNTDFRVGIQIMLAFEDPDLTAWEKRVVMLNLLYRETPPDLGKATEMAMKFLDCGQERGSGEQAPAQPRVYSFEKDAGYILAAIRQTHGIDLECVEYLHWWKFCYLFSDLQDDCFFCKIRDMRIRKARGKLSKEEREAWAQMGDILDLPQPAQELTEEEQSAQENFMRLLNGGD